MSVAEDIKNKLDQVEVKYNPEHWDGLETMLDKKQNKKVFVWWILGFGLLFLGGGIWYVLQAEKITNDIFADELKVSPKQDLDLKKNIRNLEEENKILIDESIGEVSQDKFISPLNNLSSKQDKKESSVNYKRNDEVKDAYIETLRGSRLALKSSANQFRESSKQSKIDSPNKSSFLEDEIRGQTLYATPILTSEEEIKGYKSEFYNLDIVNDYILFNSVFQDEYNDDRKEKRKEKKRFVDHYISMSTTSAVLFNSQLTKSTKANGLELSYEGFWKNKIGWSVGLGYNHQNLLVNNCSSQEAIFANDFAELGEPTNCLSYNLSRNNLIIPINFKWKVLQKGRNSLLFNAGIESGFTLSSKFRRPNTETLLSNINADLTSLELQFLEQNYVSQPFFITIKTGMEYNYSIRENWLLNIQTNYLLKMNDISESNSHGLQFNLGLKYKLK